jgi:hypothetical protein
VRAILLGLVLLGLLYWALLPQSVATRQTIHRWAIRLGLVGVILLLLRLGLPWLAMVGTVLLGALRYLGPVAGRLLPLWIVERVVSNTAARGNATRTQQPGRSQDMTRARALQVLDLPESASRDDVLRAHRELIKRLHPDRGGSSYLAAEVNRARDVLLTEGGH